MDRERKTMTRLWIVAVAAVGVLVATGGVIALARVLTADHARDTAPPCVVSTTGDAAGPVATATAGTEDYWTPERMRRASGAAQGEGSEGASPTCPDGSKG